MKITPETALAPQIATGAVRPVPPVPGETSPFEAMLAGSGKGAPLPEPAVAIPAPDDVSPELAMAAEAKPATDEAAVPIKTPTLPTATAEPAVGTSPVTEAEHPRPVEAQPALSEPIVSPEPAPAAAPVARVPAATSDPKPDPRVHTRPYLHRAFGFRELGVWGHGGMKEGERPGRACGVPSGKAEGDDDLGALIAQWLETHQNAGDLPLPRWRGADGGSNPPVRVTLEMPSGSRPGRSSTEGPRVHAHGRDVELSPAATAIPGVGDEATDAAETVLAHRRRPASERPEGNAAVNVLISETAGGLQVAAMADINPEAVARLRRLAESLAREFGLSLAQFSLNGAAVDPDRSTQWR